MVFTAFPGMSLGKSKLFSSCGLSHMEQEGPAIADSQSRNFHISSCQLNSHGAALFLSPSLV